MSENFKNSKFRILKVECNIIGIDNIQQPKESGITLKIEEKLSCRKPKNLSDEIIQLEIDTVITSDEVQKATAESMMMIVQQAKDVLEQTPPELSADIIDRGIILTGGGALLDGIDQLFSEQLRVPVFAAEQPLDSVALGTGILLENMTKKKRKF